MFISETNHHVVSSICKIIIYITCKMKIIFICKNILLRLPSRPTSAMYRQSFIPLPTLSQTFILLLGTSYLNRHRPYETMWNLVSWNPTPEEGGLFANVVPKQEHNIYVDPLASILMGATQFKNQEMLLGPSLCYMHYSLQSHEYNSEPTFPMCKGHSSLLVHSVLSQSPF